MTFNFRIPLILVYLNFAQNLKENFNKELIFSPVLEKLCNIHPCCRSACSYSTNERACCHCVLIKDK